jgi:signal transduction histidine kinase
MRVSLLRVKQGQLDVRQQRQKEKTMTGRLNSIGKSGLQFYSKISASMSHDIKNTLAIINENAGLLEDFTLMANQGTPLDPERVKPLAANIAKQVGRANKITTYMSRLAHSLNQPVSVVDLNETLLLVTALTGRLSKMRNVAIDIREPSQTVTVESAPFFLMTLIWQLLERATASGEVTSITVAAEKTKDGARIDFLFEGPTGHLQKILADDPVDGFLAFLNAEIRSESSGEQCSIYLTSQYDAPNP